MDFIHTFVTTFYEGLIEPFVLYGFMQRALWACLLLSICSGFLGTFLVLRRMSLMGEALSHGILPGIAIGYLVGGLWMPALSLGGIIAGLLITKTSHYISRKTILTQDASFSGLYLIALSVGILILSSSANQSTVMSLLFGNILGVSPSALYYILGATSLVIITMVVMFKPFTYLCFDPLFARLRGISDKKLNLVFLSLVVLTLVSACQTLGTMMALGLMIIPAVTARMMCKDIHCIVGFAIFLGSFSAFSGLLISYHFNVPSGSGIILTTGGLYLILFIVKMFKK